jgi:hypothetical protein
MRLQELNRDYLGIDAPTDVLSFPASETDPETGARYLGDILISVPRAQSQAEAAGHALESEVNCWSCMVCYIYWVTITPSPKRRGACGRRKQKFSNLSGLEIFKSVRNKV